MKEQKKLKAVDVKERASGTKQSSVKQKPVQEPDKKEELKVNSGDFIEIEYTGSVEGRIFDTTSKEVAKQQGFGNLDSYAPLIVKQGLKNVIKGLDEALLGKELGKEYQVHIPADKAFGKKQAKLIKTLSMASFKGQKVQPRPGMTINVDGLPGRILKVGGGRVIVDFNHYLAGQDIDYKFKVLRKVTDIKEQINSVLLLAGLKGDVEIKEGKTKVLTSEEMLPYVQKALLGAGLAVEVAKKQEIGKKSQQS